MSPKSKQAFYVCEDVDSVHQGETFVWLNPSANPHTVSGCASALDVGQHTIPPHSYHEAKVKDKVASGDYPVNHTPECPNHIRPQPKIIIS